MTPRTTPGSPSLLSVTQLRRLSSILPTARNTITDEGMVELRDGVKALIDVAIAASLLEQQPWRHIPENFHQDLRRALARFGDV